MIKDTYIKNIKALIGTSGSKYDYFFNKLETPDWIKPLQVNGFFQIDKDNMFYPWPESEYLKRMAELSPDLVQETILTIPPTDNPHVHADFIDAACSMPMSFSKKLIKKEIEWLKKQETLHFSLENKYSNLVLYLLKNHEQKIAFKLARTMLAIKEIKDDNNFKYKMTSPSITSKLRDTEYHTFLKDCIPHLLETNTVETINMLCDILNNILRITNPSNAKNEDFKDFSYLRRPAIEEHTNNGLFHIEDYLVVFLRDACITAIVTSALPLEDVIQCLDDRKWTLFKRVSLHIIYIFMTECMDIVKNRLLDIKYFNDYRLHHEYSLLLNKAFNKLNDQDKSIYFNMVSKGPNYIDHENTSSDDEGEIRRWKFEHLSVIQNHLQGEWKSRYEEFQQEFGEIEDPYFLHAPQVFRGPTSPIDYESLCELSVDDLLRYLREWLPESGFAEPTREGLGRLIERNIPERPKEYTLKANEFKDAHPIYINSFIDGIAEALKKQFECPWESVLDLCKWVVSQPITYAEDDIDRDDYTWMWSRKAVARLFESAFTADANKVPISFRDDIWSVIETITRDPNPSSRYESKYGGSNMDPSTLSINTVRGQAMHAVFQYALWCHRNVFGDGYDPKNPPLFFERIPEVRGVLEFHLDVNNDPSLAIRSVYGQYLPWLFLLDKEWTNNHIKNIFPSDDQQFRNAAWNAYIAHNRFYDSVFFNVKNEYLQTIKIIKQEPADEESESNENDTVRFLSQHIVIAYARGLIELEDDILLHSWVSPCQSLMAEAIHFIGSSIKQDPGIGDEIIQKFKKLWEYRIQFIKQHWKSRKCTKELGNFTYWFNSGKFEPEWLFKQMKQILELEVAIDPYFHVIDQLKAFSSSYPYESAQTMYMMVLKNQDVWFRHGNKNSFYDIFKNIIESDNEDAKSCVVDTINILGRDRTDDDYRELIKALPQ